MINFVKSVLLKSFLIFFSIKALGAPHPLMGSSIINQADNGIAFSQLGFQVSGIPNFWVYNKALDLNSQSIELGLPQRTLLSFRLEKVSTKTNLEMYVRHFLRDYNQYGFEVSGLQSIKRNDVPSVIVDLNQKNKQSRTRQMFFYKNDKMVVATCTDDKTKFDSTLKICNQILGSFQWKL